MVFLLTLQQVFLNSVLFSFEPLTVLDAFAGAAPFSVTLAKQGAFVKSIDSNPDAENWARHNYKLNNISEQNFSFHCSNVEDYNFGNARLSARVKDSKLNITQKPSRVVKDFLYVRLKNAGQRWRKEGEINQDVLDWIKDNIPRSKETMHFWGGGDTGSTSSDVAFANWSRE